MIPDLIALVEQMARDALSDGYADRHALPIALPETAVANLLAETA